MSNKPSFFTELKRRNVIRAAGLYLVGAWLLVQVTGTILPMFGAPDWLLRSIVILLAIGFVPAIIFSWVFELTPQGLKRDEDVPPAQSIAPQTGRRMDRMIIVVLVLALGYFVFDKFVLTPRREAAQPHVNSLPNESNSPANPKSIAVLPFENLSSDKENAYFAAGIQDEIITRLSKIADLRIISCTSTQRFRAASDDIPAIGRQLGVANVVEGSVQRTTDQFRVNVQLVEVMTNAQLWADTFDRERKDIFVVESEIAKTIAETLKAKLTGREQEAITAHATDNPVAHQLYLKGRYFWNKRRREDMIKALACFQQAAQQDPNYPLAYVGIADTYNLMPLYDAGVPRDCQPKAEAAARKALELDNSSGEAHASLGLCFFTSLDFDQSLGEFEKSIQLNPNYPTAHHWLAFVFLATSQFDRAIAECKRALELDPVSFIINSDLGTFYYYARRYDEAIDQFRKTIEIDPAFNHAHWSLGKALEMKGDLEPAMKEYQKARELNDDPWIVSLLAHAYAASGDKIEAQKYLKQLQETAKERYVEAQTFALVYLGLGNKDEALRWLEQAYQGRAGREVFFMKSEPLFDPLRGDPRFQAVVKKVLSHRGQ